MHKKTQGTFAALLLFVALAARADAPPPLPSVDDGQVVNMTDVKWAAFKPPEGSPIAPGITVSGVAGNAQTGPSVAYAKYPPGYAFPAHWHSFTEYTVLIKGTEQFTVGGKTYTLTAGAYVVIPPKAVHSVTCTKDSECIYLIRRAGAVDYHFEK